MTDKKPSQSYLSCAEVARRLGLSRPFYTAEQLELCLDLRRRNVGLNGKVVLFYSARSSVSVPKPAKRKPKSKAKSGRHQSIIEALKTFGLTGVSDDQVDEAMRKVFPNGTEGVEQGEVVRQIFLHLQRKNSSE